MIELPDGILYQGERTVRAGQVIEDWHLDEFVTADMIGDVRGFTPDL